MSSKMNKRRKSKNVNNEGRKEGRKEGRTQKTDKLIEESHSAKNAYPESICDEISRT
jgi:hypothetical protein